VGGTARPTDRQLVPLQLQPTSQVHAAGCSVVPPDGNTSHPSEKTSSREVLLMNTSHPSEKTSSREVLLMNTSHPSEKTSSREVLSMNTSHPSEKTSSRHLIEGWSNGW
jgi:hypothetical protein